MKWKLSVAQHPYSAVPEVNVAKEIINLTSNNRTRPPIREQDLSCEGTQGQAIPSFSWRSLFLFQNAWRQNNYCFKRMDLAGVQWLRFLRPANKACRIPRKIKFASRAVVADWVRDCGIEITKLSTHDRLMWWSYHHGSICPLEYFAVICKYTYIPRMMLKGGKKVIRPSVWYTVGEQLNIPWIPRGLPQ